MPDRQIAQPVASIPQPERARKRERMASAPCRRISAATTSPTLKLTRLELRQTLDELIAMGLIEKFTDEHGVERFHSLRLR